MEPDLDRRNQTSIDGTRPRSTEPDLDRRKKPTPVREDGGIT